MEFDMSNDTCEVDGCERPRFNRGWCTAHWNGVRRKGDPGSAEVGKWRQVGCLVESCERKHVGRGYCDTHLRRINRYGDPHAIFPSVPRRSGAEAPKWIGDAGTYAAVHWRLKKYRKSASDHSCIECGGAAGEWAYQHNGQSEQLDAARGLLYSTNLDDYEPMCRSCHRKFDAAMARG